ncbi:MAG TPA: hypothetical protein VE994_09525 [Terriglobales bacterium]|nr:hypothetical protein [Terriglobales bacterium]
MIIPNPSRYTAGFIFHSFRNPVFISFLLLFLVSVSLITSADSGRDKRENSYALILGTVWGPDNRPAYGVKVAIRRADDKKARWHLVSDHNGEFAQRVPAGKGDYVAWAESVPWRQAKSSKRNNLATDSAVKVHVENDERVDIGLHLRE